MAPLKPIVQSIQDLPPKGGYPKINAIRGVRPRGPSGLVIWLSVIGLNIFGLSKLHVMSTRTRLERKEKREARMAVQPFFMAEHDAKVLAKVKELLADETETMKGRNDWVVGKSIKYE